MDVTTTNDLVAGHLFLRLQPSGGFFQPYVEGLVGFHYLSTSTSVSDQGDDSEAIASTKHLSDFTFSYGAGVGVMFRVWQPSADFDPEKDLGLNSDSEDQETDGVRGEAAEEEDKVKLESVGIFLDVRYLRGGEADYLKEGSIMIEDGRVRYDVRHSRTDMVIFRIGVSLNLI